MTRAEKAGQNLAKAIIEMVHLMYQNNTADNFYKGFSKEIQEEITLRTYEKIRQRRKKDDKT